MAGETGGVGGIGAVWRVVVKTRERSRDVARWYSPDRRRNGRNVVDELGFDACIKIQVPKI